MSEVLMVVGSLNRDVPYFAPARGVGLSVFAFDPVGRDARLLGEDRGIDNPTFLCVDPIERRLYATSEVPSWHEGTVTAYRFDDATQRLAYINKQPSLGSVTAHCSLDMRRRNLLVANYGGFPSGEGPDQAVVVLPLRPDGGLGAPASSVSHRGHALRMGSHPERQMRPHPHCVVPSPDGRFAVVSDLGLDRLLTYAVASDGALSPDPVALMPLASGSGPRHVAFHPGGHLAVVICELDSTMTSLRYDPASGRFQPITTVPALPRFDGANHCSDVTFHPGGRVLYGANRGHDSIAVLAIDPEIGALATIGHHPCGGRTPRHLALDPAGRCLVVANQDSDLLSVFALDAEGAPAGPPRAISVGSPMCVAFMPTSRHHAVTTIVDREARDVALSE